MRLNRARRQHPGEVRELEYAADSPPIADSEEGAGGEQGFGSAVRRFITAGLYNSDFGDLSEDITQPIDDANNPLPFWGFVRSGGSAVDAQVVADAASASGYVLQWSMRDGAAGDDAYIEQVVPVNGSQSRSFVYEVRAAFKTGAATDVSEVYIDLQYLKSDSSLTGSNTTRSATLNLIGTSAIYDLSGSVTSWLAAPADAYYVRIRIGYRRGALAASSAGAGVALHEARVIVGSSVLLADISDPTLGEGLLHQTAGVVRLQANVGGAGSAQLKLDGTVNALQAVGAFDLLSDETSTLTGAQDNVTLSNLSAVMRWNGASASTWTGLTGGRDGRLIFLQNVTAAQTLVLSHDVTSTAANRFYCPNNAAVSIRPNGFVILIYDASASRWRVMGA